MEEKSWQTVSAKSGLTTCPMPLDSKKCPVRVLTSVISIQAKGNIARRYNPCKKRYCCDGSTRLAFGVSSSPHKIFSMSCELAFCFVKS